MLAVISKENRMKFEKIGSAANRPKRTELPSGTVFHYTNNQNIYLKTEEGHVDLKTGRVFPNSVINDFVIVVDATLHYKDKE
jgi:hypothetical protein